MYQDLCVDYAAKLPPEIGIAWAVSPCNLKCQMCPQERLRHLPRSVLPFDLFKKTIVDIPRNYTGKITLTPYTEPLLFPDFAKYISHTTRALPEALVTLNTNGVLLDETRGRQIIDSGLKGLIISLNMHTREDYEWFTGVDAYEHVSENIRQFHTLRARLGHGPTIWLQLVNIQRNAAYQDAFIQKWAKYADSGTLRDLVDWNGEIPEDVLQQQAACGNRCDHICLTMWMTLVVDANGDIAPCCRIPLLPPGNGLILGNVANMTLAEAWASPKLAEIRRRQYLGTQPECARCRFHLKDKISLDVRRFVEEVLDGKITKS